MQAVQFVPAALPVTGSVLVTLGNEYMPSYGAGCTWFSCDQPSKHLNCELFGSGVFGLLGSSHCLLSFRVWKKGLVGSWPGQFMFGILVTPSCGKVEALRPVVPARRRGRVHQREVLVATLVGRLAVQVELDVRDARFPTQLQEQCRIVKGPRGRVDHVALDTAVLVLGERPHRKLDEVVLAEQALPALRITPGFRPARWRRWTGHPPDEMGPLSARGMLTRALQSASAQ